MDTPKKESSSGLIILSIIFGILLLIALVVLGLILGGIIGINKTTSGTDAGTNPPPVDTKREIIFIGNGSGTVNSLAQNGANLAGNAGITSNSFLVVQQQGMTATSKISFTADDISNIDKISFDGVRFTNSFAEGTTAFSGVIITKTNNNIVISFDPNGGVNNVVSVVIVPVSTPQQKILKISNYKVAF